MYKPTEQAIAIADAKTEEVINKSNELNRPWGIEQVGVWVWVTNTQKSDAQSLKGLGMKWSSKKSAWYWANKLKAGRSINAKNLQALRDIHGSEKVK